MIKYISITAFIFLFLLSFAGQAQLPKVEVRGYFLADSAKVGQTIKYVLVASHDVDAELVFPDTAFSFAPFELVRKKFYPTLTIGNKSVDSTVYTLRTFQLLPHQKLQLAVRLFLPDDTLTLKTQPDSVALVQYVKQVTDPLALQTETIPRAVLERFNYLYWGLGLLAAALLAGSILAIFGKNITTRYKLYVLQKDQAQFQNRFINVKERFRRLKTLEPLERAIILWKNYLTKLEEEEINSFTTKEITTFYEEDERVSHSLKICDRAIYGNIISDDEREVADALAQLADFAAARYSIIQESLRNVAGPR